MSGSVVPRKILNVPGHSLRLEFVLDLLVVPLIHVGGGDSHDGSTFGSVTRDRDVVGRPVEDGCIVVLVLDLDCQSADVFQLGPALIRDLDGDVDQFLSVGLISIENLKK